MALVQTFRVQVTLNPSEAPADWIINTWHCASIDATPPLTATQDFIDDLDVFYQTVDTHLSPDIHAQVPAVNVYNLIEPKPRVPIRQTTLTALVSGNNRLPRELAACVTYRAEYVSGISPRRRRGRIYLGPLSRDTVDPATGKFTSTFRGQVATAAGTLQASSEASTTYNWVVYSPTTDTAGTGELGMYEVIQGWVDDLPDIQRRRGLRTGTRSTY